MAWYDKLFTKSAEGGGERKFDGFTSEGGIKVTDSRGRSKIDISEKSETLGDDPLAIYKPTGAKHVDAAKALGNFTGWQFAATNAIASEISNIQWRLYQIKGKNHEEVQDHPLLTLLEGVNEIMTGTELKYTTACHLELTGNCYWLLDGVKTDMDKPKAIHPLNPGRVRVKLNKTKFPYTIDHYEFTIDGKIFKFQPYEILQLKYPDPSDPYVGLGIPQAIPAWIDSDNYAMEYNRKFFINGAQVGMYIQTDSNVEGNIDRIRKSWNASHEGVENAHKTPVLPKGTKLEHTGLTHRDMDFSVLSDNTRDRILAANRVSKTILGTAESDTNRATAETADYVFSKRTIKPKMLLILSYLNEFLVPRYGDDIYLTFIDPVPEDKEFRTKEMQAVVSSIPVMTQNEARKNYMGLGPIEGGDKLLMPSTMEVAGTTQTPEGENQAPRLAKELTVSGQLTDSIRIRTGGKSSFSGTKSMRSAISEAFKKALDNVETKSNVKSVTELSHEEYHEHWDRFVKSVEGWEKKLKNVFLAINKKQREEVLKNLPELTGVKKAVGDPFDLPEWIALTIDLATPLLEGLTKDEAAAALSAIGANYIDILANDAIRAALDAGIAKMARNYNETTVDALKKVIGDKMTQEAGTSLPELTDAVNDVYDFADDRRAGLIAKTESFRAGNYANKSAWQLNGSVKTIMWYTAEDDAVCEFCAEQDGKEIPIDQNFYDEGDVVEGGDGGTMTANYGDVGAPPLHPDCRCYIRPSEINL